MLAFGGMRILEWLRDCWLSIAWITIDDLDDRVECLENKLIEIGNTIMATLVTLGSDVAAANTAVAAFISDVNVEVAALAQQISDLKTQLASAGLTPENQALVDAADANAQAIAAAVADADAKIKAPTA